MLVSITIGSSAVALGNVSPVSVSVAVVSDTGVIEALVLVASDNDEEPSSVVRPVVLHMDLGIICGALGTGLGTNGTPAARCSLGISMINMIQLHYLFTMNAFQDLAQDTLADALSLI